MGAVNCKEACDSFVDNIDSGAQTSETGLHWFADVPVDANGCRKFSPLPPPGCHPRLFFTEHEIPRLVARFTHSALSDKLTKLLSATVNHFNHFAAQVDTLDQSERHCPTEPTIRAFFNIDEGRNTAFLGTYIYAFIQGDFDLMAKVAEMVVFYARVVIASRQFALQHEVTERPFDFWHCNKWDVASPWLTGGSSVAVLYDLMFQDMEEEQRTAIRDSIALTCKGRQSWGMNWPARRIQSNWAPYNSQLYVMASAIEEEEGFDDAAHSIFENLLMQYMDYAIHSSGHPVEDVYALNFGFREGSFSLLAMARRGFNLFNHPNFKKMWINWLPMALEPHMSGNIYGGSSGSNWEYPTSAMIAKYVFPKDKVIDFVYRKYMSPGAGHFQRLLKYQARLPALLLAPPVNDEELGIDAHAEELDLPLAFRCENRGKVIMRSDWTENALWYTLDARPDCFFIGHDAPSRGAFTLNIGGRAWAVCPEWNLFRHSKYYSLPKIDGISQEIKAPFVHLLPEDDGENEGSGMGASFAAADLTYAYNWEWTQWRNECPDGFEPETHDPREFGMSAWWLPHKIHGERNVGFVGLHQWRKQFNEVKQVTRSAMMVRGPMPYMILADTVIKDEDEHEYKWAMTTPPDLELECFDGKDAIIAEIDEPRRRLLIRDLDSEDVPKECTFEKFSNEDDGCRHAQEFGRLEFTTSGSKASFKFMIYALHDDGVPGTCWQEEENKILDVSGVNGKHREAIEFGRGAKNEDTIKVIFN